VALTNECTAIRRASPHKVLRKIRNPKRGGMGAQRLGPKAGVSNAENQRRAAPAKTGARNFPMFHCAMRLRLQSDPL
jgi:hypothetical protein